MFRTLLCRILFGARPDPFDSLSPVSFRCLP
jgi:hypothetical protein